MAFVVAIGSVVIFFAVGGLAAAQAESDDVSNDSGAVVVYEDGGSADASTDSGAVLVHSDGGSAEVVDESGAVVVFADGGSPSVFNESGAVLVHADRPDRPARGGASFFHVSPFTPVHERVVDVERVTRLPVTGGSVGDVVAMALVMLGIGAALLAAARILPVPAPAPPR